MKLSPLWIIAGNLAAFCALSGYFLSARAAISHHWTFPLHEGLLLLQALALKGKGARETVAGISLLILGISLARLETIYLSRHLFHFSLAWALAFLLHCKLGMGSQRGAFRNVNLLWGGLCAIAAIVSLYLALRQGIWWGLGPGV